MHERLWPLFERGLAHSCPLLDLEAGRGLSARDFSRVKELRRRLFIPVDIPEDAWYQAAALQADMVERGTHQAPSVVDLMIAVCAERADLHVLHYDADFDAIAAVTGQPTEWIVTAGSGDGPDDVP